MTVDELRKLEDREGYDHWLFAGRLVERRNGFHSPPHAATCALISYKLLEWCRKSSPSSFQAFGYGCPYQLARDPDTFVCYDNSIVDFDRAERWQGGPYIVGPPLLAVEIIEWKEDLEIIRELVDASLQNGVQELWLVYPFDAAIECYSAGEKTRYLSSEMILESSNALPGFSCPVSSLLECP